MFESAFFRGLRRAALASGGSAIVLLCAPPQSALAVPGEQNALPEACQAVAGATYVANEASGIVLKPPLDFPTSAGAYAANWALRLCPPQIAAPPDRTGADGFDPDAVTATSDDPELANPAADDPNCYASIPQTITKAEYSDFLGIESFPSGWGVLGTPTVRHFNTDADVRLYGGAPADNPDTPGNESLADERKTVRDASGREVLKLPVGKNGLTYRADTLVSVLDFPFIYIPGVPSESKPFKELVKSSGRLRALAVKGYELFDGAVDEIAGEAEEYALDEAVGLFFRHSQLGVLDDVYNQDGQDVWVYDLIPPSLTARTDVSALPENVRAVLSYDAARGVYYLEAIEPG
ncbi:MAG TPA: hypothetical protein VFV10_20820, partial [Gammaproteobacteria bacterium]|nr:hypothetical protein [Gammaproteobacteria bacterium]